jgi:hypothetical protein
MTILTSNHPIKVIKKLGLPLFETGRWKLGAV